MDAFDVVGIAGIAFALIALGAANSAKAQIAALSNEVEALKAARQDAGS